MQGLRDNEQDQSPCLWASPEPAQDLPSVGGGHKICNPVVCKVVAHSKSYCSKDPKAHPEPAGHCWVFAELHVFWSQRPSAVNTSCCPSMSVHLLEVQDMRFSSAKIKWRSCARERGCGSLRGHGMFLSKVRWGQPSNLFLFVVCFHLNESA